MKLSLEAREGGTFVFARGDDVVTIQHRAIQPVFDFAIAGNRALQTARSMRDGAAEGVALGFQPPTGTAEWASGDWEVFAARLVQAELLALVATGWDGVTDEDGSPFPFGRDAARTLLCRNDDLYAAWCAYVADLTVEANEGNA